ncbi:hypothetical protein QUF94_26905 [Peribacillus sp. NJ4]|uniref:hypothetical protein n=1 Tax=Peribacillus sp. NJ4 TaxID=3055862 RepID=UPI0025A14074|nr:hypothetical protein [Peribacillus sp. NJ4]MDM5214965.1 hypothetical protein [Peribacillus sp. NJ4]
MYYINPIYYRHYHFNPYYYSHYHHYIPYYNRAIPHRLVDPDKIINLVGFYVDIELDNGQKICNAKLDYVSPEPDETQAIYGDVTYTIYSGGQPYTSYTNTRNIIRIKQSGIPGAVCS